MVSSEEFYELPKEDQRELVEERRVILDQDPVTEVPEYGIPIRILDKPLITAIFDRLQNGRYTVSELADEIGVGDKHVRNVINQHRHRRFENLLEMYDSVLRAKDIRGPTLVYSLEAIPYFARLLDPTLGCSLLGWNESLQERFESTDWIPAGKVTEIDEDYAWVISNFWDLDSDETFDYITEFDRRYVDTELGPLPVARGEEEYENVRNRLVEAENAYARRKGIDESTAGEKIESFEVEHARGGGGMGFYQSLSLTFFDLLEYTRHEESSLGEGIEDQVEVALDWLRPTAVEDEVYPSQREDSKESTTYPTEVEESLKPDETVDWDERDLLIELVALTQKLGRLPSETDINDRTSFSHRLYVEQFGSLMSAFRQAGILSEGETGD